MELKRIDSLPTEENFYLTDVDCKKLFMEKNDNGREIFLYKLKNVQFVGKNLYYPNCFAYSNKKNIIYEIVNELTMSLGEINNKIDIPLINNTSSEYYGNVFYFIYNTDNYYHFIYDSLPYLISFLEIKKNINDIKLLMNYPNPQTNKMYNFVLEFLDLLEVKDDIVIINETIKYHNVYISDSFTHNGKSNYPPREEIYELYQKILNKSNPQKIKGKKIYISRRSWKHNDFTNIGTNYTSRRKLLNEDDLVNVLEKYGFIECFTEKMTTIDKLELFTNADIVVGAIGGGMCNVLFSNKGTILISINSPEFLKINQRFVYSYQKVNYIPFNDTTHSEVGVFKKYMRVYHNKSKIVGEIINVYEDSVDVIYTDTNVAGWNEQLNNMDNFGFIIIRNVTNSEQNNFWKVSYNSIRKFYKNVKIIIVDNNSNYEFITNNDIDLVNCHIENSEFGNSRQLSAYYYFYKHKPFKTAIIIHDSVFLNGELSIDPNTDINLLWNFNTHDYDDVEYERILLRSLTNNEGLLMLHASKQWTGCFGNMSVININFLNSLVEKYNFFNMMKIVNSNRFQCALERVISVIFHYESPNLYHSNPIVCEISKMRWGYRYNEYILDKENNLVNNDKFIKIFAARQ